MAFHFLVHKLVCRTLSNIVKCSFDLDSNPGEASAPLLDDPFERAVRDQLGACQAAGITTAGTTRPPSRRLTSAPDPDLHASIALGAGVSPRRADGHVVAIAGISVHLGAKVSQRLAG